MKQSIVVRRDLGMGRGKTAAQAAHASLEAYLDAGEDAGKEWRGGGMKKIVLAVDSEDELLDLKEEARIEGLPHALITDAGHTQVEPGTRTALAVGPGREEDVDRVTGDLDLL